MVLFSARIRRWLLMTVGLPLAAAGAGWLGRSLERRRGRPTAASRALLRAGHHLGPHRAGARAGQYRSRFDM